MGAATASGVPRWATYHLAAVLDPQLLLVHVIEEAVVLALLDAAEGVDTARLDLNLRERDD